MCLIDNHDRSIELVFIVEWIILEMTIPENKNKNCYKFK